MLDWSLIDGPVPAVLTAAGIGCGIALLARRDRRWWVRTVPLVAAGVALACLVAVIIVDTMWRPFPDALPWRVVAWWGVGIGALALGAARWRGGWRKRTFVLAAAGVVVVTAAMKVNAFYGQYPTVRTALGIPPVGEISFSAVPGPVPSPTLATPGVPLEQVWKPTGPMPATGALTQVTVPARRSGFGTSRKAYVYLPPAYFAPNRPLLPVLVLLHGQPGAPRDWVAGGRLAQRMDRVAAARHGLAPIVVMPDSTGSLLGNPLCLDSRLGNAETYLARDVPEWIDRHLQVDPDRRHWAVGGFSYGGTCALQLALRRPATFPTFLDLSGQREPTLGDRESTVREAFDGDAARFRAVNPLDLLASRRFPHTAGFLAVGSSDTEFGPQQKAVFEACRRNGLDVSFAETPGAHDWTAWAGGLERALPWLTTRMGITAK
ncbi:esterase family protein [Amycolatopsis sp. Poz14]|uniref:alpha/beta hydrolase n=1 Tax=Amycolatopsis sp. Poz14 TaxID=1447705 RepID=UPI001EE893F2|nr:alpha/beta hydrolase-fold protein [Amycolatopsis sp. Poz14]MCG3752609.1 esterase [Amycolatopsis sp. Poz14]